MQKRLLNIKEAAKYLGVSDSTLYSWVSQKRVDHVKLGKSLRFDIRDLDKLIESSKEKPKEKNGKIIDKLPH